MAEPAPALDESLLPGTAGLDARTLWTLLAGNALTMVGVGFFLPILPLLVSARGGSSLLIGVIFAAGVGGRALAQVPAGWLADRFGRRPVIVLSLLAYALLFPVYAVPLVPGAVIGLRFLHALVGGAYSPAAVALVADLSESAGRGGAFSRLRASDMAGLLLGPALGGAVAGLRLEAVFFAGALVCLGATGLMLWLPGGTHRSGLRPACEEANSNPLRLLWLVLPVACMGMAIAWVFGTYDAVWTLYITSRGATPFLVGLSFTTYALPIVVFAGVAAGLTDRLGPVRAGTLAVSAYGLLASAYPLVSNLPALILIGLAEGALTAAGNPALMAEVSRLAPPGAQGRTQGVYGATLNVAQVAGAVAGGALYGVRPAFAFFGCTVACLVGVTCGAALRRGRSRQATLPLAAR